MPINYHPSDTTEIVKYEFVLDIATRHARTLNDGGTPPKNLRDQLKLSPTASIWVKTRDNRNRSIEGKWLIMDGKLNFLIMREGNTLKVYERPTIENCALEYRYFLEIDASGKPEFPRYIQPPCSDTIKHLRERQAQHLMQFANQGMELYCVDATVDWRLIVGLGSENVQETNMTLHHIYGIPYIPGSAMKGVLRHWWLYKHFADAKGKIDEDKALADTVFRRVFGSQKQRGEVQFLDAFPDPEKFNFATDIMNPHYPKYYGGSKPPTDNQNPVPINFLTVNDATFRFAFLAKTEAPLTELKTRFSDALKNKGIGAKTAVGYGYFHFRDCEDQTASITNTVKKQQQAEQE